jgi:hypothetical protein
MELDKKKDTGRIICVALTILLLRSVFAHAAGWYEEQHIKLAYGVLNGLTFLIFSLIFAWIAIRLKIISVMIIALLTILFELLWLSDNIKEFLIIINEDLIYSLFPIMAMFAVIGMVWLTYFIIKKYALNGSNV